MSIKRAILVGAAKGGTGKSTSSVLIALELKKRGYKVGVFDSDVSGPSIPKIMGVVTEIKSDPKYGIEPPLSPDGIPLMSVELLMNKKNTAIMWKGDKITEYILNALKNIIWDLDYIIVDMPPGMSNAVQSTIEFMQENEIPSGVVFVSTPQDVSVNDVAKAITMAMKMKEPIFGVIENMSEFSCDCGKTHLLFGSGKVKKLCSDNNITYLGTIPICQKLSEASDISLNIKSTPNEIATKISPIVDIILKGQ